MQVSDKGLAMLARFEGLVPGPYLDSAGTWTYGVGHTAYAGAPDPRSMPRGMPSDLDAAIADAIAAYHRDVQRYEAAVTAAVKVPVNQHQFDALVSWHYNTGAVASATLTKRLNAGDVAGASAQFLAWNKAGGKVNAGLVQRREAERRVFDGGEYPTGSIPVWPVDKAGRVSFARTAARVPAERVYRMTELQQDRSALVALWEWLLMVLSGRKA